MFIVNRGFKDKGKDKSNKEDQHKYKDVITPI